MTIKILKLVFTLALLTILNSCCHKKMCHDGVLIDMLHFDNFNANELDTLLFTSYNKNSNFSTRVDSFFDYSYFSNSTAASKPIYLNNRKMDIQFDWQIKLISTQTIYSVSDFESKKEVCNACIFGNDFYNQLVKYKVNGTLREDNFLTIIK